MKALRGMCLFLQTLDETLRPADFENLKMKALEGANTEARVQVAEARNRGDVGEAEKQVCLSKSLWIHWVNLMVDFPLGTRRTQHA